MTIQSTEIPVLVVDDEPFIADLLEVALEEGGYKVFALNDAAEAIAFLDKPSLILRALVTDVNMGRGKPDGWQVAKHAREVFPDLPIVYMTGDGAADWTSKGVPHSILVPKPFAPAQIVTAVSQLINSPGATLS